MDLVSSTIDKYLKHRFNVSGMNKTDGKNSSSENGAIQSDTNCMSNGAKSSDSDDMLTSGDDIDDLNIPDRLYHLSLGKIRPCCVAANDDMDYVAVGLENSQIHLWNFSFVNRKESQNQVDNLESNSLDSSQKKTDFNVVNLDATSIAAISSTPPHLVAFSRLLAHHGPVYSIKFIKNNDLMLSCSEDTTIRLWCLNTKCNLAIYRGHNYPIWSLSVGPWGEYFASASMDTTARLWRFEKNTPLRTFCGHDEDVECIEFHPNSKYVATGSSDTTVRLWSILDGKMVRLMVGHRYSISSLSFLPDGKFLASADGVSSIKIWNLATNEVRNDIAVPASHSISFNPKQTFLSTCGKDNVFRLWKIAKSNVIEKKKLDLKDQPIQLISAFVQTDKILIVSYIDGDRCQSIHRIVLDNNDQPT